MDIRAQLQLSAGFPYWLQVTSCGDPVYVNHRIVSWAREHQRPKRYCRDDSHEPGHHTVFVMLVVPTTVILLVNAHGHRRVERDHVAVSF